MAGELTALAGLSTGIGSVIAFIAKPTQRGFLAGSLGFSAGVMLYVSFVEMLPAATEILRRQSEIWGPWWATAGFFGGVLLTAVIDFLVPKVENPHEASLVEDMGREQEVRHLERVGVLTALAIGVHNFPEGFATMFAAQSDIMLGVPVAAAVALHNIPEGISVSVPVYYATKSRKKAFWFSFLSGLSEPVGALVGYLLLRPFISDSLVAVVLAAVAGVMVFISLDQLVPNAKKYGKEHHSVYGLVGGMAVMAVSLLLLH
jgi:ZIP family zinc transporter